MNSENTQQEVDYDVVICGGGLAGLTLARQICRELPGWSVAVVEKSERPLPEAAHKVGESSVELGSQYFERLGLAEYILDKHIVKFGLRFFPGGGHLPVDQRMEIGPSQEPPVRSYQLDRGRLENDLRGMIEEDGVALMEGASVKDVAFGTEGRCHTVHLETKQGARQLTARWAVDATGRNALFRRRLKLKRGTGHAANSGWFRVEGRLNVTDFADRASGNAGWFAHPFADSRWRSTSHFMGKGYWVWFIPLSSGHTSVGLVTHDKHHGFDRVRSLERVMDFLREHEPYLADVLDHAKTMDFRCLHNYSHNAARCWSADRWAMVGEAGAFVDPLYSPGSDFIAFANSFTAELMRVDKEGQADLQKRAQELNVQYRALVMGAVDIFRDAAPVYAHAPAMATKIYWDNFAYWSFPCQYFFQNIFRLSGAEHAPFTEVGARFVELSRYVQSTVAAWAELEPTVPKAGFMGLPQFPSVGVDTHLDLQLKMSPAETLDYMRMRVRQGEELVAELLIRLLTELGPEVGAELLQRCDARKWDLRFPRSRVEAEAETGITRRRSLSAMAKDAERGLGRRPLHPDWRAAVDLLPLTDVAAAPYTPSSFARALQ